jgi:transcriptional regulator with XRE-family HTH domain
MATSSRDSKITATTEGLKALVGRNIATAREDKGWSQVELANRSGVNDAQRVSKWERGIYMPSTDALTGLASALGKDLGWFFTDHDPSKAAA